MNLTSILLLPLTILYGFGVRLRNYLFNIGYSRSFQYDIMVVNVGNLAAGGTGKTPMIEYLIKLLYRKYAIATLSRGYKRVTRGFRIADEYAGVKELGDEPFQFYLKFGKIATICVGEERALAIPKILLEHPETQIILMDDAYQHRTVKADLNILLTEYSFPFYRDYLLPSGRLREPRTSAKRANVVVVTKCPETMQHDEMATIVNRIKKYAGSTKQVFFAATHYGHLKSLTGTIDDVENVIAFSGLANNSDFHKYISAHFTLKEFMEYEDHHSYSDEEIELLVSLAKKHNAVLITTEKDVVKFRNEHNLKLLRSTKLFYIAISHRFLKYGNVFDELVEKSIDDKYLVDN